MVGVHVGHSFIQSIGTSKFKDGQKMVNLGGKGEMTAPEKGE